MKEYITTYSPERINGLELMRSLFKDGCTWHGDVNSMQWAECLYIPDADVLEKVKRTLECYDEGRHYKFEGSHAIWIC